MTEYRRRFTNTTKGQGDVLPSSRGTESETRGTEEKTRAEEKSRSTEVKEMGVQNCSCGGRVVVAEAEGSGRYCG